MSEPICKECIHRKYCNRSDINFQPKPEVVTPVLQCDSFKTAKITNADRIRSMTDEELAEMLCDYSFCSSCLYHLKGECNETTEECFSHRLDWLKEEVKE